MDEIDDDPAYDDAEQDDKTELLHRMLGRLALSGAGLDVSE